MAHFFLTPHDKPKGNELFQLAADQGNSFAQYILGVNYENGDGFDSKDIEKAKLLYQTAADQDFEEAKQALETLKKHEEKMEKAKSKKNEVILNSKK